MTDLREEIQRTITTFLLQGRLAKTNQERRAIWVCMHAQLLTFTPKGDKLSKTFAMLPAETQDRLVPKTSIPFAEFLRLVRSEGGAKSDT